MYVPPWLWAVAISFPADIGHACITSYRSINDGQAVTLAGGVSACPACVSDSEDSTQQKPACAVVDSTSTAPARGNSDREASSNESAVTCAAPAVEAGQTERRETGWRATAYRPGVAASRAPQYFTLHSRCGPILSVAKGQRCLTILPGSVQSTPCTLPIYCVWVFQCLN